MTAMTLHFAPGDNDAAIAAAMSSTSTHAFLELEDGVHRDRKKVAREAAAGALAADRSKKMVVRINQLDSGEMAADLEAIVPHAPDIVLLPMLRGRDDLGVMIDQLSAIEQAKGISDGSTKVALMIETASAAAHVGDLLAVTDRVAMVAVGICDLMLELDCLAVRDDGFAVPTYVDELQSTIVLQARAAGVAAVGVPLTRLGDTDGLADIARHLVRERGYNGLIVGDQKSVDVVDDAARPSLAERDFARGVVRAATSAATEGRALATYEGWLVEGPLVQLAKQSLEDA